MYPKTCVAGKRMSAAVILKLFLATTDKRLIGTFQTNWAGYRLKLDIQPNDL